MLPGESMSQSYTSFDTALGTLAIAWTNKGICAVQLSEESKEKTIQQLRKRLPNAQEAEPSTIVKRTIHLLTQHLSGSVQDFSGIPLDLTGLQPFSQKVYEATRAVKAGSVASYSDIALKVGAPDASRAVGRALGTNPVPIIIPCHRIIGKNGAMTGFSAYGACDTKMRLLSIEKGLSSDKVSMAGLS